jgi:hypothetical protein
MGGSTREAIESLLNQFCRLVDSGAGAQVSELFTIDATVVTPHFRLSGREAIRDWFSERAKPGARLSRHSWTNLDIAAQADASFMVRTAATTLVGTPPAPATDARFATGIATDHVVLEGGRALFASRELEIMFEGKLIPLEPAS